MILLFVFIALYLTPLMKLANAKPVFDYPLPKAHMVITPTSKTQTHFSLGDDEGQWESVTKSSMKLNGTPDMVQYGRQDRKRSTVLDHPDLEKVPMQSVHQQDFKGAVPVTGATSNDFVKELKATHFSLGDTGMNFGISQYQATYKPSTGPAPHRNRELPPSAFPAPKQCIILEDFPDRCLGKSSQRDDYRDFSGHVKAQAQAGRQMKEVNSKSSVYFGLDGSGLSNKSHSVTSGDFAKPAERDFALAQESYGKAGVSRKPDIPFYDPINVESETMHGVTSVAQSDFHSHPIKFTARQDGIDNKAYLRTHHFSFGELEKEETAFAMQSSSQYHFKDPEARRTNPYNIERRDAAGAFNGKTSVGSRHESDNYEKTLMNTISRWVVLHFSPLEMLT